MTREQAITILSEKIKPCVLGEWGEATDMAIEALSADAVHGEWLYVENEPYSECSKCGRYIDDLDEDKYAYCPYCGSRMKGGAE